MTSLIHRWVLTSLAPDEAGDVRAPAVPHDPGTPESAASQSLQSYNAPGMERGALCGARRGLDASCRAPAGRACTFPPLLPAQHLRLAPCWPHGCGCPVGAAPLGGARRPGAVQGMDCELWRLRGVGLCCLPV